MGTRETDLTEVPQRQRGEGVEDGGGERDPCETRVRELPNRTGKPKRNNRRGGSVRMRQAAGRAV
ncbi:MAG TPA: hypothetical protein VEY13_11390 [Rubrobacteraceae bacterium]|nr:hypothetical protein [Rubrobacteraceae bacterium]